MSLLGPENSTSSSSNGRSPSAGLLSAPLSLSPGQLIAERYKILSVIGQGAMGSVYKVEQVFLRKIFALKTLRSIAASDLVVRRFQKEAQAASRLDHPNLVRAVDFGLVEGSQPFFVMEFVQGVSFDRYLKEAGRLTIQQVREIFIPICRGMSYAHREGVIHRDIKPSNIVLVPSESGGAFIPKVVDFGIAKLDVVGDADEQTLTKTGEVFGTPLYMSPEQCAGEEIDKRSDIYSLGCVIFEALTGAPPFHGRNALETMMQHRMNDAISLKEATLGLPFPRGLEGIVAQMLAKDPAGRYRDCLEVARDLDALAVSHSQGMARQKEQSLTGDVFSKLNAIGNLNLTISGKSGMILLLAWLLCSGVVLFALNWSRESSQPNAVPAVKAAADESHEHSLFNAIDETPDDQNLVVLLSKHPGIEKVYLPNWQGTNGGLSVFTQGNAKFIKDLRLKDCNNVNDEGMKYLRHLPLVRLDLDDMEITDKGMEEISQIRTLEYLNLRKTGVGDKSCVLLAKLPKLRYLLVSETAITGATLSALAKNPELKELFMDRNLGVNKHLSALLPLRLTELSLARNNISDDDLDIIAKMHGLTYLSLDDNQRITDKGLLKLARLPRLSVLRLSNCSITPQGVSRFKLLKPACEVCVDKKAPRSL